MYFTFLLCFIDMWNFGLLWQQVFEEEIEELAQIPRNEMTEELVKEMPALRPHFEKYKQWRLKRDESIAMKSSWTENTNWLYVTKKYLQSNHYFIEVKPDLFQMNVLISFLKKIT